METADQVRIVVCNQAKLNKIQRERERQSSPSLKHERGLNLKYIILGKEKSAKGKVCPAKSAWNATMKFERCPRIVRQFTDCGALRVHSKWFHDK